MLLGNSAALYIAYLNSKGTNSGLFNQSFNSYLSDSMSSLKNYFKKPKEEAVKAEEEWKKIVNLLIDDLKQRCNSNNDLNQYLTKAVDSLKKNNWSITYIKILLSRAIEQINKEINSSSNVQDCLLSIRKALEEKIAFLMHKESSSKFPSKAFM